MKKQEKRYVFTPSEYKNITRNEARLVKLKDIVDQAHRITRQIKPKTK